VTIMNGKQRNCG